MTIDRAIELAGLVVIPLVLWWQSWRSGRVHDIVEEAVTRAREQGEAKALAESQRAATAALHSRLDDIKKAGEENARAIAKIQRQLLKLQIEETNPGRPNPLLKP